MALLFYASKDFAFFIIFIFNGVVVGFFFTVTFTFLGACFVAIIYYKKIKTIEYTLYLSIVIYFL